MYFTIFLNRQIIPTRKLFDIWTKLSVAEPIWLAKLVDYNSGRERTGYPLTVLYNLGSFER